MPLPTTTLNPDKTIVPTLSYATFTPSGTPPGTPVTLVGKMANYEQTLDTVKREAPSASDKLLRPDRIVPIRQTESFKFELEDVARLSEIFGDSLSGLRNGTVQLIITDPDDAASTASLQTNKFKCSAQLEGGMTLTAGELAKVTITFTALEPVTVKFDAAVA